MDKVKKIAGRVLTLLCVLITVLAIFVVLVIYNTKDKEMPVIAGHTMLLVVSSSMEPEYMTYTCVFVEETDVNKLKTGDDISFYSEDPSIYMSVVTHRIEEIEKKDGKLFFTTKGINNDFPDGYQVPEDNIIGKVTGQSQFVGSIVMALQRPEIFMLLIAIPVLVIVVVNIRTFRKTIKDLAKRDMLEGSDDYRYFTLEDMPDTEVYGLYRNLQGEQGETVNLKTFLETLGSNHYENDQSFRIEDEKKNIALFLHSCDLVDNYKTFINFLITVDEDYISPGIFKQALSMQKKLAKQLGCQKIMILATDNQKIFYENLGFSITASLEIFNKNVNKMVLKI